MGVDIKFYYRYIFGFKSAILFYAVCPLVSFSLLAFSGIFFFNHFISLHLSLKVLVT